MISVELFFVCTFHIKLELDERPRHIILSEIILLLRNFAGTVECSSYFEQLSFCKII